MLRLACFLLIAATMIGALMPSSPDAPGTEADNGIIYTPQSSGSSYRVVGGDSGSDSASSMTASGGGALRLSRESDGHFYADVKINGTPIRFLVDTGASGVALSRSDAQRAGIALGPITETVGEGASGAVLGQWTHLDRVELGGRTATGVNAVVLAGGDMSLLGQSVLREFAIDVRGDEMVLR